MNRACLVFRFRGPYHPMIFQVPDQELDIVEVDVPTHFVLRVGVTLTGSLNGQHGMAQVYILTGVLFSLLIMYIMRV